jgi:bla regulator protein blaR1
MTAPFTLTADLIRAFGWALLHSFWQAFLIFACLRLIFLLVPKESASIRYNLSYISLTGIFVWFGVTLWQQLCALRTLHEAAMIMINTGVRYTHVELPAIYQSQNTLRDLVPHIETWFPLLVCLYVSGVLFLTVKLIADLVQLRQIRRQQVLPADAVWEKHLEKLSAQLRIPRKVQLLISSRLQVPVMIGFFKPVILLPVLLFNNLTAEQLEAILLHELAHVKRNDYLLNIFQSIVETILFFNPFVWWISKTIRLEREHCCDDLVVKGPVHPLHYAKALVTLEEYRLSANSLAMAAADNKQHLFHRIKRIMEMKTKNINYSQKLLAVVIMAAGIACVAWLNPPAAEAKPVVHHTAGLPGLSHYYSPSDTAPKKVVRTAVIVRDENSFDGDTSVTNAMAMANEAMKNIDWQQINAEVSTAMQNINWDEINKNVEQAMKNIDWKKMDKEIRQGVEIGMKAAKEQMSQQHIDVIVQQAMASAHSSINSEEIKESIRKGMEEAKKEMPTQQQLQVIINDAMKTAKVQMDSAMTMTMTQGHGMIVSDDHGSKPDFKEMISKMTAAKLIDKDKGYKIEKKSNGDLYINGVKQSDDVKDTYSDYTEDVKTMTIVGKKDDVTIAVEE